MDSEEKHRAWADFENKVSREVNPGISFRKAIERRSVDEIELHLIIYQRPDLIARIPYNSRYNMGGHLIKIL